MVGVVVGVVVGVAVAVVVGVVVAVAVAVVVGVVVAVVVGVAGMRLDAPFPWFGGQAQERMDNGKRERIWFSPACLPATGEPSLFDGSDL